MTSSILASGAAGAADPGSGTGATNTLEDVIVTAQKRAENLQDVPVSIQTLDTRQLEQLQINDFAGYAKYLTSLSTVSYGPSQAQLFVRGIANGADVLPVGAQPLVGLYLDEMPVTTIANNLDVHIYDIARVEALAGPQGTLYGASSMAGTLRIITNKPSTAGFEGGYDLTANTFTQGAAGGKIEGFVNVPLSDRAAIRLVGFAEHDGGYINNVLGPPETYPTSGFPHSNAGSTRRNFNPVDTNGGRAALEFDASDRWTITPAIIAQQQEQRGVIGYLPSEGDLNIVRYLPDRNSDSWWQATLTVEGKISALDLIYAGGVLHRHSDNVGDYSDYTYFYDVYYQAAPQYFGDNFRNNAGQLINPAETALQRNVYEKQSHELRLATPKDWRLHGVAGVFLQRQTDRWRSEYRIDGLADQYSITNLPGVLYLNSMVRTDRDQALFTDWTYDVTPKLAASAGVRLFAFDNTVYGFFGYNSQPRYALGPHASGEQDCFPGTQTNGTLWPCVNVDHRATKRGDTHRVTLTYTLAPEAKLYATWSNGYRPGGVNRVLTRPPYDPDYLTNFEAGWKTEWFGRRLRFNGALFLEQWKDPQVSIYGVDGIALITNAGAAQTSGVEAELAWSVSQDLTLTAALTALDAKLTSNFCKYPSSSSSCAEPGNSIVAPDGSRLPVSPRLKGNLIARYQFRVAGLDVHLQAAAVAQSNVLPALDPSYDQAVGRQPGYASFDFAAGLHKGQWQTELFVQNAFDRRGEFERFDACAPSVCSHVYVLPITPRLVGITVAQKF